MRYFPFLFLVVYLMSGCEKEVFTSGADTDEFPLFVHVDVHEVEVDRQYTIDVRPSPSGDFFDNVGAIGTVYDGATGMNMVLGIFDQEGQAATNQRVRCAFKFWPETFTSGRAATLEELRTYFEVDRIFPFEEGPGAVRFSLALPSAAPGTELSSSAFAPDVAGSMTVEGVFPYFSNIPGLSEEEGSAWLVRVSFSGTIGIFDEIDFLAAQADGVPYVAKATATVAGEANLVLETTWR